MTVIQAPTPIIRVITKGAFFLRFTETERTAIRTSSDTKVIDLYENIKFAENVGLDFSVTTDGLDYLKTVAILLDQPRVDALLVNGTEAEKYTS